MTGVCDLPFRVICKEGGAGLVCAEMVSSDALSFDSKKSQRMLTVSPQEHPVSLQIFGGDPKLMAEAAKKVEAGGADIVDINFGCPVRKITRSGAGSILLKDQEKLVAIVRSVVKSVKIPVTAKVRSGHVAGENLAPEIARRLEAEGASAVSLHARPVEARHSGQAQWDHIAETVQAVKIPVIGNGGISGPEDVKRMLQETGCAGVMVGRASIDEPSFFSRTMHFLETGELRPPPTLDEKLETVWKHAQRNVEFYGERLGLVRFRKFLAYYITDLPGASRFRARINVLTTLKILHTALEELISNSTQMAAGGQG